MQLKEMYNRQYVADLVRAIQEYHPSLDGEAFARQVFDEGWPGRELKERTRHISVVLSRFLPADYRAAIDILSQAAPLLKQYGFENIVFSDYVEVHGLDDWDTSIPALEQFTQLISAEYAVRPFIVRDQPRMMAQMERWAGHDSADVRRLASEGCRPRLPWGIRLPALQADPSPILPILGRLKDDPSEWVRRSVANNLNDISKDNPNVVLAVLRRWLAEDGEGMRRIAGHALRSLLKAGHPGALAMLGYGSASSIIVRNVSVEPESIPMGGEITLSFEILSSAHEPQELMIDYVVHLVRARGQRTPKVFKLSKRTIRPGETLCLVRKHSFAPVTTRKYYPGPHAVEVQINGATLGRAEFIIC